MRSHFKFEFDIEDIEPEAVQNYIWDLALLTATDADDWNYRFIRDWRNNEDLICFVHPRVKPYALLVSDFLRPLADASSPEEETAGNSRE